MPSILFKEENKADIAARKYMERLDKPYKEARKQAESIMTMHYKLDDVIIMDQESENVLKEILDIYKKGDLIDIKKLSTPTGIPALVYCEMFVQYGIILQPKSNTYPKEYRLANAAFTYFDRKARALEKQEACHGNVNINGSNNIVYSNIQNSNINIDNSMVQLQQLIKEKGGEDKAELLELCEEIKEILANIEKSSFIPNNKGFFKKLSDHCAKHGWLYGAVASVFGQAIVNLLGR